MRQLEAVFLTEVNIAGDRSRTTPATLLKDCWVQASKEAGINILDNGVAESVCSGSETESRTVLSAESSLLASMHAGNQILRATNGNQQGIVVVTGALHVVSMVLRLLPG